MVTVHTFPTVVHGPRFRGRSASTALFDHVRLVAEGTTGFAAAADRVLTQPGPPGLTVVISDLLTPEWDAGIARLPARRGEFVVHLLDRTDLDPDLTGDLELVDAETGERLEVSCRRRRSRTIARWRAAGPTTSPSVSEPRAVRISGPYWRRPRSRSCSAGHETRGLAMSISGWGLAKPDGPALGTPGASDHRSAHPAAAPGPGGGVGSLPVAQGRCTGDRGEPWQRADPQLAAGIAGAGRTPAGAAGGRDQSNSAISRWRDHTVFVIDASASMRATDGSPDRLSSAVDRAEELRGQMPEGGEASLIVAGPRARALLSHSTDASAFVDALDQIRAGDGAADFAGAFALASGLDTGEALTRMVLISDGGVSDADLRAAPIGARYSESVHPPPTAASRS
ncbi:MAG: VWA domain-containing protein [Acidimicrobiales bacterium]